MMEIVESEGQTWPDPDRLQTGGGYQLEVRVTSALLYALLHLGPVTAGLAMNTVRCSENGCSVRCSVRCSILNMFGILFGPCSCSAFGGCRVRVCVRTACSCSVRCSGLIHMLMLNANVECQCRMPMSNANVECQC